MAGKWLHVGTLIILSLAIIGGISVVGLLQSAERVGTSGIITQSSPLPPPPSSPPPTPPEPAVEIDVYSDVGCTQLITAIDWGTVEAGGSVKENVYIKNNGDQDVTLSLVTENWNPAGASDYMMLSWNYDGSAIEPSAVIKVTLTLSVKSSISGIENFSFDIVVIGSAS